MMRPSLTRHFAKHLLVTDLFVWIGLLSYNLVSLAIPVCRVSGGEMIILIGIIDLCLVGIKLVNNFDFRSHR